MGFSSSGFWAVAHTTNLSLGFSFDSLVYASFEALLNLKFLNDLVLSVHSLAVDAPEFP